MKHKILSEMLNEGGNQIEFEYEYIGNGRISIYMDGQLISKKERLENALINYKQHGIPEDKLTMEHEQFLSNTNLLD